MQVPDDKLKLFTQVVSARVNAAVQSSAEVHAALAAVIKAGYESKNLTVVLEFDLGAVAEEMARESDPPEPSSHAMPGEPLTDYDSDYSELEWLRELLVGDPCQN